MNNRNSVLSTFFQSAHPYKYAGEKVDVQGLDIFKVSSEYKFAV